MWSLPEKPDGIVVKRGREGEGGGKERKVDRQTEKTVG